MSLQMLSLFSLGHGSNLGLCDLLALGLLDSAGSPASKDGLAVLVELQLLDDALGGVNANLDSLTYLNKSSILWLL